MGVFSSSSGQDPSDASAQQSGPVPSTPRLSLDVNGLYILLRDQGLENEWLWGFYLHRGLSDGWIFYVSRPADSWLYDHRTSRTVVYSLSIAAALRIGVIEPLMHETLRDRIGRVPLENTERFGDLTCRTWLLRAVGDLDNEGYISLLRGTTVEDIEQEAMGAASESSDSAGPKGKTSQYSIA